MHQQPSRAVGVESTAAPCGASRNRPGEERTCYGDFVGQTEAKETVVLIPRVTGFLEKSFFKEGSTVHVGDALIQIEPAAYRAALEQSEAKLAQDQAALIRFQRDVARLEPLVKEQAATQQDFDSAV